MKGHWCRRLARGWLLAIGLLIGHGTAAPVLAEPVLTLRVPAFPATQFPNGSSIVLPESGYGNVEVWLEDALAEIQVSTIRVRLNEVPMATFITTNRLPRGVRVIVRLGASVNPDFSFRSGRENVLSFAATDTSSVEYQAQYYITLAAETASPHLAARAPARPPVREVAAPPQAFPPTVRMTKEWPAKTADRVMLLEAEVSDREGLRRIVVELNGRAIEEVVLENELPVRKQRGFIAKSRLPGSVTGDGQKVAIAIPVTLDKRLNTVGLRVENLAGLVGYEDHTIELTSLR
jgi:hypothetical protein